VYVGIVVQSRALPVAWCVMPQQEKWDEGQWEIIGRLFAQVACSLTSADCTLLADRGLSCLRLIKACKQVGWHSILRLKNAEWFRRTFRRGYRDWEQGKRVVKKEGEQWYGKVLLWQEHSFETSLSACWEPGYDEAWLVISDRPASPKRVREYARCMRVEAPTGCATSYGDLSSRYVHKAEVAFTQRRVVSASSLRCSSAAVTLRSKFPCATCSRTGRMASTV